MILYLEFKADIAPGKNHLLLTFFFRGSFLNNVIILETFLRKYQKMFGNNRREFIISLPKNPKCKSDQLSLSLLKNGLSLSQFFLTLLLIVGTL